MYDAPNLVPSDTLQCDNSRALVSFILHAERKQTSCHPRAAGGNTCFFNMGRSEVDFMDSSNPFELNRKAFKRESDKNVVVIMRYGPDKPFQEIESTIKDTLLLYGLKATLAKDVALHEQLWDNVRFCMDHCCYGVVVFERILQPDYNPNVALELGYMLAKGIPCLILKDVSMPRLQTDIIGHLYTPFDSHSVRETVAPAIEGWLRRLGHSTVVETIYSNEERTRRILSELSRSTSDSSVPIGSHVLRQAGSLSSFAISDNENFSNDDGGEDYKLLLLHEREMFTTSVREGATVKIMISPDTLLARVRNRAITQEYVTFNILPRYEQLIETITANLESNNFQIVYSERLKYPNLLVIDERVAFLGDRRLHESGFPKTEINRDPVIIKREIKDFDTLFNDSVRLILRIRTPTADCLSSQALKSGVLQRLKESMADIERLHKELPSERDLAAE